MRKKFLAIVFLTVCCASFALTAHLAKGPTQASDDMSITLDETTAMPQKVVVNLLPMGTFTEAEARNLVGVLQRQWKALRIGDGWEFRVLPKQPLTRDLLNEAKIRYDASKILEMLKKKNPSRSNAFIALTHNDISSKMSNRPHGDGPNGWGILGLASLNKCVCVVSTYRIKPKSMLWKTVTHEFLHSYYGVPHCPNDDATCIMADAKGKPKLKQENTICASCRAKMK